MDKDLTKAVTELVNMTKDGVSFLSGQIPDVVHQLLVWKMTSNIMIVLVCLCFIYTGWAVHKLAQRKFKENRYDDTVIMMYFYMFVPVIAFFVGLSAIFEAIQIYVAPKVYLLEYVANLTK